MIYDKRNRDNLNKLADNTKIKAYQWYQYCIDNKIQILIYETIRTKAQQAENVKNKKSQTMRSYHIVGQALDFVFVDSKGNALWSINDYVKKMEVIKYAKSLGFTWGGDWDNDGNWKDETFLDSPHLQYEYKGYGKDTFGKIKVKDGLTIEQYNELKKLIDAQAKRIKELESEIENRIKIPEEREVAEAHEKGYEWAIANGISDGSKPYQYATREQVFTMLSRMK